MKKLGILGTLLTFCMVISFINLPEAQAHPALNHAYGVHKSIAATIQAHPVLTAVSATGTGRTDLMSPEQAYPCRNHCHNQHNNQHNNHHNNNNGSYDTTTTTGVTLISGAAATGAATTVLRLTVDSGNYGFVSSIPLSVAFGGTVTLGDAARISCSYSGANATSDGIQPAVASTTVSTLLAVAGTLYATIPLVDSIRAFSQGAIVSLVCTATTTTTSGAGTVAVTALPGTATFADRENRLTFVSQV